MAQTILVTGASGFIAAHVVATLLRRGYNVRGTVRSEKSAVEVFRTHSQYPGTLRIAIVPDIAAPGAFDEAVQGVDGVRWSSPWKQNTRLMGLARSYTLHRRLSLVRLISRLSCSDQPSRALYPSLRQPRNTIQGYLGLSLPPRLHQF